MGISIGQNCSTFLTALYWYNTLYQTECTLGVICKIALVQKNICFKAKFMYIQCIIKTISFFILKLLFKLHSSGLTSHLNAIIIIPAFYRPKPQKISRNLEHIIFSTHNLITQYLKFLVWPWKIMKICVCQLLPPHMSHLNVFFFFKWLLTLNIL